ncbi:MAG: glycoside hydrolase family 2 TIM barrel-domain containing protein, partial [Woeseiaceae bacterium]
MVRTTSAILTALVLSACAANAPVDRDTAPGSTVQVVKQPDGTFTLLRNGEPYLVKGAGMGSGDLQLLAASGGNSIRTWSIDQTERLVDGKPLLDRAHELGISVTVGFWVQHVRHGFDYSDSASIEKQRAKIRSAVLKFKDHPAVLAWGLGNEMEGFEPGETDVRIWQELNHLADIIKDLDRHHPVVTVIAGANPSKITGIRKHYPNLDILGVNAYSGAPVVGQNLVAMGWNGPY